MNTVKVEVNVCKETSEIFKALSGLVKNIRAKKPVAEIVAAELNDVINAVSGFEQIPEEVKSIEMHDTIALGVSSITKELMAPAVKA